MTVPIKQIFIAAVGRKLLKKQPAGQESVLSNRIYVPSVRLPSLQKNTIKKTNSKKTLKIKADLFGLFKIPFLKRKKTFLNIFRPRLDF